MAYEPRTYLYEILIRYDKDGLKGHHIREIEELVNPETGEVRSKTELPARPITKEAAEDLIGRANADAIEKIDALVAKRTSDFRAEMEGQVESVIAERDATVRSLTEALEQAAEESGELRGELETANGRLALIANALA